MEVWDYEGPLWLRLILINNISFKDIYFKVRVGSTFSGSLAQEMVVPQGINE